MVKINADTLVDDLKEEPEFAETAVMFQGRCDGNPHDEDGRTLQDLEELYNGWFVSNMTHGLLKLAELSRDGKQHVFQVYSPEEIAKEPLKANVRILVYPGDPEKPFVLVTPGGGYKSVCSMVEGFPVAADFQALGHPVIILNYRTNIDDVSPYFPIPLDDTAAALQFIRQHAEELGLKNLHYAMAGFSAGGNLTDTWGLDSVGYGHYKMQKPDCLFSNYAVTDLFEMSARKDGFLDVMLGADYTEKELQKYDVVSNITEDYPPCYITAAVNDALVPVAHSKDLAEKLKKTGIPYECEIGQSGGHGYGNGGSTPLEGWIDRADAFWKKIYDEEAAK